MGGGIGGEIGGIGSGRQLSRRITGISTVVCAIVASEPTAVAAIAISPLTVLLLPSSPATTAAAIAEIATMPSITTNTRPFFTFAGSSCPARAHRSGTR